MEKELYWNALGNGVWKLGAVQHGCILIESTSTRCINAVHRERRIWTCISHKYA